MVVVNPVSGELNTITYVNDFSCYFVISFSGDMNQQYFDRGETLMVCEAEQATQITNVIPNQSNESPAMKTLTLAYDLSVLVKASSDLEAMDVIKTAIAIEEAGDNLPDSLHAIVYDLFAATASQGLLNTLNGALPDELHDEVIEMAANLANYQ
ncbi:hypothetical protein OGX96_19095 [Citrobacter sp. Cpo100]|uniref:hypothetical protein n=1 Tax=Citrobacter sp. Cpo100 TaxID=2985141 RepID=UPI002576F895|nr:hypothetical protein [Citrobacter sp. Cpo100]MDM2823179.1 hypothetical protein [Citrobacter sp. Cpo100]